MLVDVDDVDMVKNYKQIFISLKLSVAHVFNIFFHQEFIAKCVDIVKVNQGMLIDVDIVKYYKQTFFLKLSVVHVLTQAFFHQEFRVIFPKFIRTTDSFTQGLHTDPYSIKVQRKYVQNTPSICKKHYILFDLKTMLKFFEE